MNLPQLKNDLFQKYHSRLADPVKAIAALTDTHQNKAKQVNKLISDMQNVLSRQMTISGNQQEKQQALLVIQYCTSVISLEYRHMVWPYEYMALSRRVGELWERSALHGIDRHAQMFIGWKPLRFQVLVIRFAIASKLH